MVSGNGKGVFPDSSLFNMFHKGEYVCEYVGDRVDAEKGKLIHAEYKARGDNGSYIFEVQHKNQNFCINATRDDGRMGRLINHSKMNPNIRCETIKIGEVVHLVFFAIKDIHHGEELLYDYGDALIDFRCKQKKPKRLPTKKKKPEREYLLKTRNP